MIASLPPSSGLPRLGLWPLLAVLVVRAAAELVRARVVFGRISVPQILARNENGPQGAAEGGDAALLAWIAYAMPRVARRMPFRSDCLVQALAAQSWLAARGIGSRIVIGAERPPDQAFAAHAWLTCGNRIITGGDTQKYTVLL